jgi:uncharacterized membrane protein
MSTGPEITRSSADRPDALARRSGNPVDRVLAHWIFGEAPVWGVLGVAVTSFLVFWYFFHFGHLTSDVHRGYGDSAFDIGLYDQGVWLLSHFHAPYVTLMGRDLFGDHTQFSLIAMVPLYWLRPDATTLLYVQAFVMALGAVPVYLLAMRVLKNPAFATVLAAAFLLHPALAQSNLENYHPDSFLIPILGFAIYAAVENKPRMFVIFSVLALLCKEDVVLVLFPLAVWFAIRRNRQVGALVAFASVLSSFVATNVIMRLLIGVPTLNTWRIPFGGIGGLFREALKKPAEVVKYVIRGDRPNGRPFYVWQMIAPTGLVFFAAPEIAITTILVLGANVMSTFGYQHLIGYHYSMAILPGIAMGTVYAVSRLASRRLQAAAVAIVGLSALWSGYLWGPYPFSVHHTVPHWSPTYSAVSDIHQVEKALPPGAVVSVYYSYASHVDHRTRVYMWPTPFAASSWKTFKQEGQRLPEANDVEYLLLPPTIDDHPGVFDKIRTQFVEVARAENDQQEGAVLYRRGSG